MYAALMAGIGNYLCTNFHYAASNVRYGGTDDFWNKFGAEKVKSPGLIYGSTSISFPNGLTTHGTSFIGKTNTSETKALRVKPVKFNATITLGMIADNENDHFDQIHRYVEMATFAAKLQYRVTIPGMDVVEIWESTVGEFSELSPAPGGRDSNTYDSDGRLYKLEATFTVQSQFLFTDEMKLVRCIVVNGKELNGETLNGGIVSVDSDGNKSPNMRK